MSNSNKAAKAGIGYLLGNILVKGINFLTLPLFSRVMTPEEFGVYNVFLSYDAILFVIIGFAIHSSIRSANLEFKGQINAYTSSVSLIYIGNAALFLILVGVFGRTLSSFLQYNQTILYLLVLHGFSNAILTLYYSWLSLDYSYKKYIAVAASVSAGNVCLSLLLIFTVFRADKAFGRILGSAISITLVVIVLLLSFYVKAKPRINTAYWRFAMKYSLPIVPHGLSQILLAQFDRIMIRSMVSNSAAGIYSLVGNIKMVLVVLTDSIATAWTTWFYESLEKKEIASIQQRGTQLTEVFLCVCIASMAISPELVLFLGGNEYSAGNILAFPMIADAFIIFVYNIIVPSEYYMKKTKYIMYGTMIAAGVNLITNYIFIKLYGFAAAAYTTLFSYIIYLVLHLSISYRLLGTHIIKIRDLLIYVSILAIMMCVCIWFQDNIVVRLFVGFVLVAPILFKLSKNMDLLILRRN